MKDAEEMGFNPQDFADGDFAYGDEPTEDKSKQVS